MNDNRVCHHAGPDRHHRVHPGLAARLGLLAGLAGLALSAAVGFAAPNPRPPRPTMIGRVEQGTAPCSATPSDLSTLRVVLIMDDGSGVCDAGDSDVITDVAPSGSGGYAFPAATGEPGWQGEPAYCIGVQRVSLATPPPFGVVEPGTDDTTTYEVGEVCVP